MAAKGLPAVALCAVPRLSPDDQSLSRDRGYTGNLSGGVRQLNGVYTQATNRRHHRTGSLFQRRFKGILVDKDSYQLELSRYVVLNPVRARLVRQARQWPWSSYRATWAMTNSSSAYRRRPKYKGMS